MASSSWASSSISASYALTINPALSLSPASLPADTVKMAYNQTITASGGIGNQTLTYSLIGGTLPTGLSISPASPATNALTISGTPTMRSTI